jgi:ribulose-phosphate 3-epimerase
VGESVRVRIAPSLLSADFSRLAEEISDVERGGADMLHLDIMDGHFVPNLTFGPPVVRSISRRCTIPLDAHLMVSSPDALIPELAQIGVSRVAVHQETCDHLHRTLMSIGENGMEAGVALNPATPIAVVEEILAWTQFILVMSVDPGFCGQEFIPESLDKIRRLRRLCGRADLDISVDGGVTAVNAGALASAGATTLVAGSAVFGDRDRFEAVSAIRNAAEKGIR